MMKAGRELDALVAEQVMGIELCHHELDKKYLVCKHCHVSYGFWKPKWGTIEPPRYYSTNIAAAWKVVEKMDLLVGRVLEQYHGTGEWAVCELDTGNIVKTIGLGRTAPHAICLAALRAKGIEV